MSGNQERTYKDIIFFSIIMVTTDNERQVIRIITGTFFFLSRIESENKSEISKQKKK